MFLAKKSTVFRIIFLFFFLGYRPISFALSSHNVWDVLRQEFRLNHETHRPEVQTQIRWLMTHPSYMQQLSRAEPYIYHIVNEIKIKHLPGEIALIPLIESSFDPFAYSHAGAAGLWQIMPETGNDLGLTQNRWMDARRSIGPSTQAALHYLTYLHRFFNGDWNLAFAAYNAGEGTIARIVKSSGLSTHTATLFWSLKVPQETKAYVPRLLALAEMVQHPHQYHIELPDIPHTPYFEEVHVKKPINLSRAAELAGMSHQDLMKLNPGFNHWSHMPYQSYHLLLPTNKVALFSRNLAQLSLNLPHPPSAPRRSFSSSLHTLKEYKLIHVVQQQDSITSLAKKYHVSEIQIIRWNQLSSRQLTQGSALIIWRTIGT